MKTIYTFGNGNAEGRADMKELLGGKGANLAEMNLIGVPVPPGFTITCDVCKIYNEQGREAVVNLIKEDVIKSVHHIESLTGYKFNDPQNPQLVSVRSGAPVSMPGMMDTVLNLGINDEVAETLAKKSGNERFAWDSYRRFVQMYGDVVLGMKPQNKNDIDPFEEIIEAVKTAKGVKFDTELDVDDLKQLVKLFKKAVKENTGKDFPTDAWDQLWGAIYAVFDSWNNERAILYRQMNQIPESYGTAVNVQAMVYGNMGNSSATGVCFSRDAGTGENLFNGEYLINAQGEDVVAGSLPQHPHWKCHLLPHRYGSPLHQCRLHRHSCGRYLLLCPCQSRGRWLRSLSRWRHSPWDWCSSASNWGRRHTSSRHHPCSLQCCSWG